MHEFLKFIIQPVVLERDESGRIVGEQVLDPSPAYSVAQVQEMFDNLNERLQEANEGEYEKETAAKASRNSRERTGR
jgi:ectoine hydroxylase-related dioxygenase (phytanoyl-CoA dioxygenase family)